MIITKEVKVLVNNPNVKHYKSLGYLAEYRKELTVLPKHLTKGSHICILVSCDNCGTVSEIEFRAYWEYPDGKNYCRNCADELFPVQRKQHLDTP